MGKATIPPGSFFLTRTANAQISFSTLPLPMDGVRAGLNELDHNEPRYNQDKNIFLDVNNDGIKDHLHLHYDSSTNLIRIYKSLGAVGPGESGSVAPRDKVTSIEEGVGDKISINYARMNDPFADVYTRNNNSINA